MSSETPFSTAYLTWLKQLHQDKSKAISSAVDAVGLAGLANVSSAPQLSADAKHAYEHAEKKLTAMLENPITRLADETLVTIILLSLYQVTYSNEG